MVSPFFMTHKPSDNAFLLNKNDFCIYFELIKKNLLFFSVGGTLAAQDALTQQEKDLIFLII